MKKIVIAMVAISLAAVSQAAFVDWALARDDAKTWGNAEIYAVDGSTLTAMISMLEAGGENVGTTFLSTYAIGGAPADTANSRGAAGLTSDIGSANSLAFIIFQNNTIADGKNFYYTDVIDVSDYTFTPPADIPNSLAMEATSFANSGTVAAPEPTSGLLLLLGVAGLALKRKRA